MEIKTLSYTNLLKLELPFLARTVARIIESHNPEELKIEKALELLGAQQRNIELLTVRYGAHPITEQLKPVRKDCFMYAQAIVYRMKMVVKEHANNPSSIVLKTNQVVNRFLHRLVRSKDELIVIEKLTGFFGEIDEDEALKRALINFDLIKDADKLRIAQAKWEGLLREKIQSESERPQETTKELSAPLIKTLKDVFKIIEVFHLLNPELDYAPLINELNQTIQEKKNKINKRLLHNKKKSEQLDNKDVDIEPDTQEETASNPMIETSKADKVLEVMEAVAGKDFEGEKKKPDRLLDINKILSSPSKNDEMPSVNKGT